MTHEVRLRASLFCIFEFEIMVSDTVSPRHTLELHLQTGEIEAEDTELLQDNPRVLQEEDDHPGLSRTSPGQAAGCQQRQASICHWL